MRVMQFRKRLPLVVVNVHDARITEQHVNEIKHSIHSSVGQCRLIVHNDNIDITLED